jgi:tape measure domain-containing protein
MAAPEIRLSIGLDLEFFRGQMRKAVNIAQSEFTAQLAVKIDRNKLNTELNNLQKAIKRRTYRIEIGGNLDDAPSKIASLKKALSDLEGTKIDLGVGGITSIGRDEARKIRTALRRSVLENGGKILVPTSIVAAITEDDVAAFQAIVKRKLSGIKASLSVVAGINSENIATFEEATQSKLSGIKVPVSILPKISAEDIAAFKEAVKNKLSGIKVKVGVEAQVSGAGAGAATVPGEKKRPAGYEAALQSIGNLQVEQLRKRAFSSLGQESRSAQQVGNWLDIIVDQGLKGKAKARHLTAIREFLADALATAAGKNIEARMQPIQGRDPNRRGAFPYVAKTGPIESKVLFAEAIALAAKIDAQLAEQARLLQEQTRRQAQYLARQNELLRNAATRFLPSAKEQIGGRSAQSQVVGNFYDRIRKTEKVFAQNFSANSYLPKASMMLASSMDGAATQLKALPATRIAGALPSSEMRLAPRRELYRDVLSRGSIPTANARPWQKPSAAGPMALPPARIAGLLEPADVQNQRKFRKAIEVAATVDAVNAAKHREQLKVNAENQVRAREAAKRDLRNMFTGLPPIQAPSIGQEKAPLSRAATRSLNKARQLLGMSIGPTSPYAANPWAGSSTVPTATPTAPSRALPPAGATSNYGVTAQRQAMAQAFQSYGFRQAPSIPPPMAQASTGGTSPPSGPPVPPGGGGAGAGGGAGRRGGGIGGLNIPSLPGTGLVQELGTELAFAAKQVLLFGTAYKALAFLTGFPQQVMNAVSSLQSFQNTLRAVTPSAQEFGTSSKFILSLVDQYNIPLQSARDGFAKLYASMKPAGFSGQEIRGLFEGVSMGAATFGMSADKVDRVMYAFAQMASKGQVMSEELKGQLGDVLPGALALFARAAKMSLTDFGKAMEDGAFKGKAMRQLLINVGATMKEEFGKGAVGAALTFQGVMNRLQTTTVLFYEAFEPLAVAFANTFVFPLTNGVRVVTDAFRQLTTGQAALTQGGSDLASKMQPLIPVFSGIGDNIKMAVNAALDLAKAFVPVVQLFLQLISIPIVGVLAQVYTSVLLLNSVFTLLGGRILLNLIGSLIQTVVQMTALNLASVTTTASLTGTRMSLALLSSGLATTGAAATAFASVLRTAMMTTVVGAIATAVAFGISEFMRLRGVMDSIAGKYKSIGDQARLMGESGNVSGVQRLTKNLQDQANTYEKIAAGLNRAKKGGGFVKIDKDTQELLKRTGFGGYDSANNGILTIEDANNIKAAINNNRKETEKTRKILAEQESKAKSEATKLDAKLDKKPIPPGEEKEGAAAAAAAKETARLEAYRSLQDQLAKAASLADIARIQDEFEERFRLANSYYDLQEARANSFQKITINFQKELLAIEQRRQKAMLDAELDVRKARESVASEAMGTNGSSFEGAGTGFSGAQLQGATSAAAKFNGIANMCSESVKAFYKSLGVTLPGVTAWADTVRTAGETMTDWSKLKAGDIVATGRPGDTPHVGVYTGGENVFHQSRKRGLKAGNYPDLNYFKQGGYFVRPNASVGAGAGAGAGAPGKILGSERRQTLATQQTGFALNDQRVVNLRAEKRATEETAIAIENYVAAIAPVAEQELQNQLLSKRIELMQTGIAGDYLDAEIKVFEIQEKQKFAIASATAEIERNNKAVDDGKMGKDDANRANAKQNDTINRLIANVPKYITLLELQTVAQQKLNFEAARGELNKQMTMARALTPDAELRVQLGEKYPGDISMQEQEFAQTKLLEKASKLKQDLQNIASSIGNAFGDAFSKVITGAATAQQALAGMFQGIADSFAQMVQEMIAQWLKTQILEGFGKLFNLVAPLAGAAGGFSSGAAGFGGGFDSGIAALPGIPDFSGAFKTAANGAVWTGGFQAFADGGIVKGPTLGLVGEGRYNEAVVPLPDGKSIPVDLSGMGGGAGAISTNIVINVNNGQAQSNTSGGASDLGRKMEGAVKQVLANELRPGGLLSGGRR